MAKSVSGLAPARRNPRKELGDKRLADLRRALGEYGDLSGIVFNRRTGELVGGHQRVRAWGDAPIEATAEHDPPTRTGTVLEGHVVVDGERHRYREVDWPRERQEMATVIANNNAGEWEPHMLAEMMRDLEALDVDMDLTMFDEKERLTISYDLDDPGAGAPAGADAPAGPSAHAGPGVDVSAHTRAPAQGSPEEGYGPDRYAGLAATCPRCKFQFDP